MSTVSVWAPLAHDVRIRISEPGSGSGWTETLVPIEDGWFSGEVDQAQTGRDYGFLLDGGEALLPDPRSRRQPQGVHGPSRFWDAEFAWSDDHWTGRGLPGAIIYELHIGTFTPEGTLAGAVDRLEHLVDLGVTHVELLPVNDFNGEWNWGYDGVLWYAVHEAYGGPDALQAFVDACHARGLAVILDVVYNHLGPSGNYLPEFGPYLKEGRNTWGDLVNLDGPSSRPVRDYIIENALMWFHDFHVDGLRLDAVHALHDDSRPHLLAELSERVEQLSTLVGRPLILVAESDLNDPMMVTGRDQGGCGIDGQWDDDVHHALHALVSGERQAYYEDFGALSAVAKVLTRAFFHDGTYSTFRGRPHGKPVDRATTPGYRFVAFLQDHDQVGNRARGDRLSEIAPRPLLQIGVVLLLTSPFTPMLWMGEEWAASTPWPFFTSHPEPDLAEATAFGRIAEFTDHGWDVSEVVDPQDPEAFQSAKLDWDERSSGHHREMLELYRTLLRLRREYPALSDPRLEAVDVDYDDSGRWLVVHRGDLDVVVNLCESPQSVASALTGVLFSTDPQVSVHTGSVSLPGRSAAIVHVEPPPHDRP
jgi:maltooligosyltrehalose trehalohydrolase